MAVDVTDAITQLIEKQAKYQESVADLFKLKYNNFGNVKIYH